MLLLRACLVACLILGGLSAVAAQEPEPLPAPLPREPVPAFVVDVRGVWARLKQTADVADALGVAATELPGRGLGLNLGAHFYPIRRPGFALGLGGELLRVRASNTVAPATLTGPDGPTVKTRWSHLSPQISLNFGARDGWSYLTAGLGRSHFTTELDDDPQASGTAVRTLNYGGGARWFAKKHVAVNLDLRFYSIGAQEAAAGRIALPQMRLMVFSGGIAIR